MEAAAREAFDLILMDMQMPEMDGLAATRAIRGGTGPCAAVPIIALTADASAERRRFYDNVGLTEFLTKPINTELLGERLRLIVAGHDGGGAAGPVPADAVALLDETVLDTLEAVIGAAGAARLTEMLDVELRDRPRVIQRMIELDQRQVIMAEAHSLKGATLNVGALRIGGMATRIEEACAAGDPLTELGRALIETARATRIAIDERGKRRGVA